MNIQQLYGPPPVEPALKYGVPNTSLSPIMAIISLIMTPVFIICCFIIGSTLYFITHKKIFIFIPLILSFLYLIYHLIFENLLGIYF